MRINTLTNYLLGKFPLSEAEIWDPSGFSLKFNTNQRLTGVVLSIDLTSDVLEFAIAKKCNLIITHHPFKFLKTWDDEFKSCPYKKDLVAKLSQHKISVISFHTNFDNAKLGTSKVIAQKMGFNNFKTYSENYPCIVQEKIKAFELINLIKNKLDLTALQINFDKNNLINEFAILAGSGPSDLLLQIHQNLNINYFITSDVRWNQWILYEEEKINVICIPHLVEQIMINEFERLINYFLKIEQKTESIQIYSYKQEEKYHNV
ncbi:Nif3-like dinuclear metal center hexameric protein [Mycoplasmopsis gallinarum]|uniref:Nif3-like dinuclear metal center hexameric protein n=1 Tax=Mycoplasmopsis gallinarum TaxID=29557 RepID=UPI0006856551|nr:Nif3-like dinuclear metal center hexameric protein [Mycoplasmopsis gallinarum]